VRNIEHQYGEDHESAGAAFVAGFGAVVAKAAAEYIESNRHLLVGQRETGLGEKLATN
jgi:hypothetical protein